MNIKGILTKRYPELLALLAVGAAALVNNLGFFSYVSDVRVLEHIRAGELFSNLVVTPLEFVFFVVLFHLLGRRMLGFFPRLRGFADGYAPVVTVAFGMGAFNLALFLCGSLGIFRAGTLFALIALAGAASLGGLWPLAAYRPKQLLPDDSLSRALLLFVLAALAYGFITALSPPASWDAVSYLLPFPRLYAAAGKIYPAQGMVAKQCTLGMEMLTGAGFLLGNDRLGQLFSFLSQALLLRLTFLFAKKYYSAAVAYASAAVVAVMPLGLYLGGITNTDFSAALFSMLAVVSFWEHYSENNKELLRVAAVALGFALNAKMTGLITAVFLLAAAAALASRKKMRFSSLTVPVLIVLVLSANIFIRNYAWTGNPLFPLFAAELPGKYAVPEIIAKSQANDRQSLGVDKTVLNYFLLSYYLIAKPGRFQHNPQFFAAGAVFIFLCRLFVRKKLLSVEKYLLAFALVYSVLWFSFGIHVWRYLLPVIPFAAVLLVSWCRLPGPGYLKAAGIFLLAANSVPFFAWNVNNKLFAVFALPSREHPLISPAKRYLEKSLDYYEVYEFANRNLPPGSRVLLFREMRGYYLERDYLWGDPLNQSEILYHTMNSPRELGARLAELGVTHVVVNFNNYSESKYYYDARTNGLMNDFLKDGCTGLYSQNNVSLFKIN